MKVKRLVSVLLAALLLVGMIPMNAMAALTWSNPDAKDLAEVKIMVSKTAPTAPSYGAIAATATAEVAEPVLKANATAANGAWSWDKSGSVEVEPGTTIYLGFKVNVVNPDQYPMVASYLIGLQYDPDILSPAYDDGSEMTATDYDVDSFKAGFVLNGISSGAAGDKWRVNATSLKDAAKGPLIKKYMGGLMVDSATGARVASGEYNGQMPLSLNTVNNKNFAANTAEATWDFVFPMYVKDDAKGTATVSMVSPLGSTSSEVVVSGATIDGNTALSTKQDAYNGARVTLIQSNDVTVKVASNDPDLAVAEADKTVAAAGGNATLVVSTNGKGAGTFADAATTATNWTVEQTGKTPSVSSVTLSADKKKATLSVTGVDAGEITVKATDPTVLTGGSGTLSAVKFTAVAAPTGTYNYANNTITLSSADASVMIKGSTGTNPWLDATSTTVTLTPAMLTQLNKVVADGQTVADAIVVALKDNKNIKSNISITKGAAPAAPTIDYENETVTFASTVEATSGVGTGNKLTPGTNAKYRTKATASALASDEKTLTVPARPTLTVTAGTDATVEQQGKTKVTVTGANAVYTKDTNATATTVTGSTALATGNIDLALDEYLHAQIKATTSAFASAIVNVQGKGWNYSKVDVANKVLAADQTTITLTKTGPIDWAAFSAANFELKESDSTTTIAATALNTTTGELTIASAPVKGKNYVLTVKKAAIAGGALNSKTGSDQQINLTGPTDDAVSVSAGDGYTLDTTTVSKGAEVTITVTAGLEGKSIKTVTSSDTSKLTVLEFSGKTIKVKAADTVSGTAALNPVTLTITAEPTALEYAETTSVELADATEKTIAPTNAADLTGVTVTVAPVGSAPADGVAVDADNLTLKTAGDKFSAKGSYQYTVTGSNGATKTITITVTGIQATPDFSAVEHKWDNTTGLSDEEIAAIVWKDKDGNTLTPDADSISANIMRAMMMAGSDVGTQTVTLPADGTLTVSGTSYDIAAGTYNVTVTKADTASVEVGAPTAKAGKISAVAEALAKTPVTVTTDTGVEVKKTLGDLVSKDDIQAEIIKQVGDAAKAAAEEAKTQEAAKAFAADPANDGKDAFDTDGNPTADFTTWAGTATTEEGGDTTWSAAITAAGTDAKAAVTADTAMKKGDKLDLTQLTLGTAIDDDNINNPANTDNYDTSKLTNAFAITGGGGGGGGGSYVPSVELVTDGFGTADGPVELDENNKITKLPGVTGQKLGSVFKGWATQDGNPLTIVKEGREITADTTLYGIFEGYMNGDKPENGKRTARPNDNVTRGELVTMLVRAAGIYDDSIDYTTTFADAKDGWYAAYVGCAETAGILTGDAEGTARPKDNITREEAAILIAKTFKVDVAIGGTTDYVVDFNKTAGWAKDYVAAIVNNGTAIGNTNKEYEPKKPITRAEVAAMINKYLGLTAAAKTNLSADTTVTSPFTDVTNKNGWYYAEMIFASLNAPDTYYGTEIVYPTR